MAFKRNPSPTYSRFGVHDKVEFFPAVELTGRYSDVKPPRAERLGKGRKTALAHLRKISRTRPKLKKACIALAIIHLFKLYPKWRARTPITTETVSGVVDICSPIVKP